MIELRKAAHLRGYDHKWNRLSALKKKRSPLCEDCLMEGRTTPVDEVDHIQPISERPDLRLVWSNLKSLCKSHHRRKTLRDRQK